MSKQKSEPEDAAFTKTFSVYQKHVAILEQAQGTFFRRNLSDTLQFVLEDYARIKQLTPTAPARKTA